MSAVTSHITLDSVFHSPTDHGLDPEIALIVGSIARASVEVAGLLRYEPFRSGDGVEQPLGTVAHDIFLAALRSSPVRAVLSAEASEPIPLDASASFAVAITALDGSGNIATNAPTGTIFSVLRAPAHDDPASAFLHAGRRQIFVAGFVMYGAATVMALSLGQGTDLFVLDHGGTFVRTHGSVAMPTGTREFAVNAANYRHWDPRLQIYVDDLVAGADGPRGQNFDMRWTGAIVAEAYRILLSGGIFLCPSDAVDSDVDIYSMDDIIWALTTRVNPNQDLLKPVPGGAGQTFIPSERVTAGSAEWTGMNIRFEGGIGIDATVPYGLEKDFMRPVYPIDRVDPANWFDADQIAKGKALMKTQSWAEVLARTGR